MAMGVFENWTPESVPCPRCRVLLPSADAPCPQCHREAAAAPSQPAQQPPAYSAPASYAPASYGPEADGASVAPPVAHQPPGYALVRPTHRGPRLGWIVLLIVIVAALGGTAYGLHRITKHANHQLAGQPNPVPSLVPVPTEAPLTLAAIPVRVDELPYGWNSVPPQTNTDSGTITDAQVTRCMGVHIVDPTFGPKAESHYELDNSSWIDSVAQQIPSRASLRPELGALDNPKAAHCLATSLRAAIASAGTGVVLRGFRMHVSHALAGGPRSVVWLIAAHGTLSANGRSIGLYVQSVLIANDEAGVSIDMTGIGAPIDVALRDQLVDALATRLTQFKP